jgi:phosphate uptake regulator
MKRKVVKHGPSTYIISLPSKWVKEHNINKGSELEVIEEGNNIIVSSETEPKIMEITFDITDLDRTSIMYTIRGFYRLGYDVIYLKFNNPSTIYQRENKSLKVLSIIHTEVNRLIGYEIIQEREKSCIIKDLQGSSEKDFDQILRRVFFLLIDATNDFVAGAKTQDLLLLETIEEKHDTITKFISYCLRLLNKKGHSEYVKTAYYYHIIASLDRVMDIIKYSARNLILYDQNLSKEILNILEIIRDSLDNFHKLFYNYTTELIRDINNKRYTAEKMLGSLPKDTKLKEAIIIASSFHILEILLDLVEARTALEY